MLRGRRALPNPRAPRHAPNGYVGMHDVFGLHLMLLGDIHFTKVPLIGGEGTLRLSMEAQHALYFLTFKTVRWWWRKLVASALWSIWVAIGSAENISANSSCNFSFVGLVSFLNFRITRPTCSNQLKVRGHELQTRTWVSKRVRGESLSPSS